MMRLLHWILAPRSSLPAFPAEWGIPPESPLQDARFSVLYSDIGKEFYARAGPAPGQLGWVVTGALSTQWAVPPQAATAVDQSQWKWFSRDECIDLWKQDAELIKSDVVALAKKGQTVHTFLPDKGVGQFSIQRLMTFDEDLKPVYPPEPWGVRLRASKGLTFATWTFELGTKTMVLTRLRSTAEDLPALLEALKFKAQEMSFDTVETWDIPQELKDVGDQLGARTFEREEHLSAAKWYGPEPVDQLEWVFNEKYVWITSSLGCMLINLATQILLVLEQSFAQEVRVVCYTIEYRWLSTMQF